VPGERTWGKHYVRLFDPVDSGWWTLIPERRIEAQGEAVAGALVPDGPIPEQFAASLPAN
jgi:hypothetical protein